mmetsp:Transcript_42265/g.92088  ORF Transcript_42265/g.92088 Transcript_42265/m.92088 type:complete len:217 (+) Transcript_42265:110-760(+)
MTSIMQGFGALRIREASPGTLRKEEPEVSATGASPAALPTREGAGPFLASEEVGLLHDAQELLLVHLAIAITICLINHLLELLIRHSLPQLLCDALQVLEGDLASLVIIKKAEGLEDLVLGIAVQNLVSHHFEELLVANGAAPVVIHVRNHLLDLLFLGLKAERAHGHLEFLSVNLTRSISVEEVEGLFDLLLLLFGELFLFLARSIEASQGHTLL